MDTENKKTPADYPEHKGIQKVSIEDIRDINITPSELLENDTKANVDAQLFAAKKHPRNLKKTMANILAISTQDIETAESCFYAVMREGKVVRGASIRFAEIIAHCYGNMRSWGRIVAGDGRTITAQGFCWDLESNTAFGVEVRRSILDSKGKLLSDNLQILEAHAACAIALRNAIFKTVPPAITNNIQNKIKRVISGEEKDFETVKKDAVNFFLKEYNVTDKQILTLFNKQEVSDLTRDDILDLKGIVTGIREGYTSVKEAFKMSKSGGISKQLDSLKD